MNDRKIDPSAAYAEYLGVDRATADALIRDELATPPDRHDSDECAKDLQAGLQYLGASALELPDAEKVLGRGGAVLLVCPACRRHGLGEHLLNIRKAGDRFVVVPVVAA